MAVKVRETRGPRGTGLDTGDGGLGKNSQLHRVCARIGTRRGPQRNRDPRADGCPCGECVVSQAEHVARRARKRTATSACCAFGNIYRQWRAQTKSFGESRARRLKIDLCRIVEVILCVCCTSTFHTCMYSRKAQFFVSRGVVNTPWPIAHDAFLPSFSTAPLTIL